MIKLALAIGFLSVLGLALYAIISAYVQLSKKKKQYNQTTKNNQS